MNDAITARYALGAGLLLVLMTSFATCAPRPSPALSQDAPALELAPVDEELALAVAQVAFNEAPNFLGDLQLIWQATRAHGETSTERLAWLREHSDCVLTDRPMTAREIAAGNCRWTRNLDERVPGEPPAGWPAHWTWEDRWDGHWERTLAYSRRLVGGMRPRAGWPCEETPLTWGSDEDASHAQAVGLTPLICVDRATGLPTRNTGYTRARRDR